MGEWDPRKCLAGNAGNAGNAWQRDSGAWQQDSKATWDSKASWEWKKEEAEFQAPYAEVLEDPVVKRAARRHTPAWSAWMISEYHAFLDQKLLCQAARIDMLTGQLAEMHTLLDSMAQTHMEAEARTCAIISENQRINEYQLAEVHAYLENASQSDEPTSCDHDNEKPDDSCDDNNEKPDDYKRAVVACCIQEHVHTRAFSELATQVDFQGWTAKPTDPDGNHWHWISRLQGMNIPIALLPIGTSGYGLLYDRLCSLAQRGRTFTLDSHNGSGKYNPYACTSIICNDCQAKLVISHPGLPAKGNNKSDADLITKVNKQIVHFFFTQEEIDQYNLLAEAVCTVERNFRGIVKTKPPPTICSPLVKVDTCKKFKLNMFSHVPLPPGLRLTSCGPEIGINTAQRLACVPRAPALSAITDSRSSSVSTSSSSTSKLAARPQIKTSCTWPNKLLKSKQIGS